MKNQTIRKLAAAVAMSLVVGASLVACGGKTESTAASSVTKTGTGKGFGGDIVATLTVEADGTVSDCKLEGASETESIGGAALEELAKQHHIQMPMEELLVKAEAFAIRAGGRSPRVAKQFIEQCESGVQK